MLSQPPAGHCDLDVSHSNQGVCSKYVFLSIRYFKGPRPIYASATEPCCVHFSLNPCGEFILQALPLPPSRPSLLPDPRWLSILLPFNKTAAKGRLPPRHQASFPFLLQLDKSSERGSLPLPQPRIFMFPILTAWHSDLHSLAPQYIKKIALFPHFWDCETPPPSSLRS